MSALLRSPALLLQTLNLAALGGMTYYFKQHHDYNLQEHEARMDELEGTLRGHIGLIEESLERLEGKAKGRLGADEPRGAKAEALYMARGRDEKKEEK
ncbi:hypothetical protein LTR35_008817 [Friedmanniomyces endolithicus]|nr:hypothetical protein LTR35_008817 [Friedmanniomyces endolithicus]KAK0295000.1 hypothetical protein LTS00_006466 [Friedmanniomyces endolithicus]KAK0990652.1 hypothetical protein LTR54_012012 [Friedmanniomyces endolithicus]